jgi:multidrug efflux pump subunit AcrA (membrane-fusion protein)
MAQMDDRTRTLPLVVEVDEPSSVTENPGSLRLRPGMFVSVKIKGKEVDQAFVIPRHVVYPGDIVYTVEDNHLKIKPVNILRAYKESVIVNKGLSEGDQIIKTPLSTAADGMLVRVK